MEPITQEVPVETQEVARNLATIQKIASLSPIEGADKIELAKLEGLEWQVVVGKGRKVGELVAYVQVDTIAPDAPWSQFLKDRHFRVRTIRLKKQLSQGLIVPLGEISNFWPENLVVAGADITAFMGISKFEKPIPIGMQGKIKGNFPTKYVAITDEERLQNCSRILGELQGVPMHVSVKLDGSSATYIHFKDTNLIEGEQLVCSRRFIKCDPAEGEEGDGFYKMNVKYGITEKLKTKGNYAVQGELVGPGCNGNKMGLKELDLFIFNVKNIDENRFLNYDEFVAFTDELGLQRVPVIATNYLLDGKTFADLMTLAESIQYNDGSLAEGLVFRPMVERYSDVLKGRSSFKVVSNKFLEHYKE